MPELTNRTINGTINPEPEMDKVIGVSKLRTSLASILKDVKKGAHYIIVQRSRASAVLLSPEEVETLEVLADRKLLEDILKAKEDIAEGRAVSYEEYFGKKSTRKR